MPKPVRTKTKPKTGSRLDKPLAEPSKRTASANGSPPKNGGPLRGLEWILKNIKPVPEEWLEPNKEVSQVSGSGPWGKPALVDDPEDVPEFPRENLPNAFGDWATAVAENSQTPVALPATMGLAAVAASLAKKAEIQPYAENRDYVEPANLYLCTPQPSAARKSFVVQQAKDPLDEFLRCFLKEHGKELSLDRQKLQALEKQKGRLVNQLSREENATEKSKIEGALQACLDEAGDIDVYTPRFFADDVTPERLVTLMSQHRGRIAILSDEGGCFDHFAGLYTSQPNLDVYLHAHNRGTIYRDRQLDGEAVCVEQAALTIGVSPQPQVIAGMGSKERLLGRGLLARFLWSFPKSTLGSRSWDPRPIPEAEKNAYSAIISRLLGIEVETPTRVKLSKKAFSDWRDTARSLESELGEGGELSAPGIQAWAGKLPGANARIAMILHYISGKAGETKVSQATMRNALAIGDYLIPHAKIAFKVLRTDPASESARVLQGWVIGLESKGETKFTKSQAQQNHKQRFPSVSDIEKPLQILVDRQICRPLQTGTRGPGRPSSWYEVNPDLRQT